MTGHSLILSRNITMQQLLTIVLTLIVTIITGCAQEPEVNTNPHKLTHSQVACFDGSYNMRKELAGIGEGEEKQFGSQCGTAEQGKNYIAGNYDVI